MEELTGIADAGKTIHGPGAGNLPRYAALVLDVVDRVPAGKVLTYGDVAEYLGEGGPRQVGAVMARYGGAVAWWRVLRADGTPAPAVRDRAVAAYHREGTPMRPDSQRVDMRLARWSGEESLLRVSTC